MAFIKIHQVRSKITLWKIYAWFYLLIVLLSSFFDDQVQVPLFMDISGIIVGIACVVALFAYVYQKAVLTSVIWKALFIAGLIWDIIYCVIYEDWTFLEGTSLGDIIIMSALTIILIIPSYIAHFMYAFRSKNIWKQKQTEPVI